MNVAGYGKILEFFAKCKDTEQWLSTWYKLVKKIKWQHLSDVKKTYPQADYVDGYTVFNVKGNKYRLITRIIYRSQTVSIVGIYTHAEYDKGKWKT